MFLRAVLAIGSPFMLCAGNLDFDEEACATVVLLAIAALASDSLTGWLLWAVMTGATAEDNLAVALIEVMSSQIN